MLVVKKLLLVLLILISVSLIFTKPGAGQLENFYNESIKKTPTQLFVRYPPATYLILRKILEFNPPQKKVLFAEQTSWTIYKFLIFTFYILSWLSLLYISKLIKKAGFSYLDISLAYFLSVPLLLASLALSYFEIFAVPFLILSMGFLLKGRYGNSYLLFLLALSFNLTLAILSPLFSLYIFKKNRSILYPIISLLALVPFVFVVSKGFPFFAGTLFSFHWLTENLLRSFGGRNFLITNVKTISIILISVFTLFFFLKFGGLLKKKITVTKVFIFSLFSFYLTFLVFFPGLSEGNLIFLPVFSLFYFLQNPTDRSKYLLFFVNLLVFLNFYLFRGLAGVPPVRGTYFEAYKYIFLVIFLIFFVRTLKNFFNSVFLKIMLIASLIFFNFALIPAQGNPDIITWKQWAEASIKFPNPFEAYTVPEIDEFYPPLSIAVIGIFANLWKNLFPQVKDYFLSIKLSTFFFYMTSLFVLLKLKTISKVKDRLYTRFDYLLVILSTFSLIIQSQGYADIDIYILPFLAGAILTLFKKKYFLSGILFAVSASIKWQPILIAPIFVTSFINTETKSKIDYKNLIKFLLGLVPSLFIVWVFVIIQPGGLYVIKRSFLFLISGHTFLSGQALNLGWIASYFYHIFQPQTYLSLEDLGGLNRQIPLYSVMDQGPSFIFRGILFYVASFTVLVKYLLTKKKTTFAFLSTCLMVFFSHHMLNKSAYEGHFFYIVGTSLMLFLVNPTPFNRLLLILVDVMNIMQQGFFYGFTGPKDFNRLFFGFDLTILFSVYYLIIYFWLFKQYLTGNFLKQQQQKSRASLKPS